MRHIQSNEIRSEEDVSNKHLRFKQRLTCGAAAALVFAMTLLIFWLLWRYLRQAEETMSGAQTEAQTEVQTDTAARDRAGAQTISDGAAMIRVRILGDHYETSSHSSLTVTSKSAFTVAFTAADCCEETAHFCRARSETSACTLQHCGEGTFRISAEELSEGEACVITPDGDDPLVLPELSRAQEAPEYGGQLLLYREPDGIALVNLLPLEAYLCSVVASEMPSDYPQEAQLAQAVCARTYAANCIRREKNSDNRADLDDSVAFQVYNNQKASEASARAVTATAGEILPLDEVLYYSTSCGTCGREDLADEAAVRSYLEEEPRADAEYGSPWIRWEAVLSKDALLAHLQAEFGYPGDSIERLQVTKRLPNGQAQELTASGGGAFLAIEGEYQIRRALAPTDSGLTLHNGQSASLSMLPSAWFVLRTEPTDPASGSQNDQQAMTSPPDIPHKETDPSAWLSDSAADEPIRLLGGGYGHGKGMSQCGAAQMAADGADYREILNYYYGESELSHVEDF